MPKRKPSPDETKNQAVVVFAGFVEIVGVGPTQLIEKIRFRF